MSRNINTRTVYKIIGSDYSAQEPRMTTFLSGDPTMYKAYLEGKDLYAMIAQSAFDNNYEDNLEFWPEGTELEIDGQKIIAGKKTHLNKAGKERRSVGKVLNLAATYGMGGSTAGAKLGKTAKEGEELLNNFFKGFPGVEAAIKQSKIFLKKYGYVEDFVGRRRRLSDINLPPYVVLSANPNEQVNFNPFINCEDEKIETEAMQKWKNIIDQKVQQSQVFQRKKAAEQGRTFEGNNEMGNATYKKLAEDALKEGVIIQANTGRIAQASRQCFNARIQGCLGYNELVYTDRGIVEIGALANQNIKVWDGNAWSSAVVLPSGKKQKCILTTNIGQQIICSPDHKFLTINTYGTEKFKKLSEIKSQDRIVFTPEAPKILNRVSFRDSLGLTYGAAHNTHNYSFDDIENDYIRGQILGRIASDGSYIKRENGSGCIYLLVAEHEIELLDYFKTNLPFKYSLNITQKKNQKIYQLVITSTTLVNECLALDIKHQIPACFYQNTELLRGFISGFFDGDGTANNKHVQLDFGTQSDFTKIIKQMQNAISAFGIKSTVASYKDRYRVVIRKHEARLFAERIGFISKDKQVKALAITAKRTNKSFNNKVIVCIKSIEVTDEYIDMYDVCNTERGYFIVNGLVTHNSAASLTKMAMVDIFNDLILKNLQAELIITVHDEVLVECPAIYAEQVEKRLPEIMIEAAKKVGDDVPQACDPYNVSRWYSNEAAATVLEECKKLEGKGKTHEEAVDIVCTNHSELPREAILEVLSGRTDELNF